MVPEMHMYPTSILSPTSRLAAKNRIGGGMIKRCQDKMTV